MTDTTATPDTDDRPPLLDQARAAMGLTVTQTALDAVTERLRLARAVPRHEVDTALDGVMPSLLAGDPLPDDLAGQVLTVRQSNAAALAESAALAELERRLRQHLLDLHTTEADRALAFLSGELHELLTRARPILAALGGVDTAERAIDAGKVDQWRDAGTLARRHQELRDAQRILVSAALDPPLPPARPGDRVTRECRILVDNFGHVEHPERHGSIDESDYDRASLDDAHTHIVAGRVVTRTGTDRPANPRPWLTGDSLLDLRFVAIGRDLQPWVSSIEQLLAARGEHHARRQAEVRAAAEPPRSRLGRLGGTAPLRGSRETAS